MCYNFFMLSFLIAFILTMKVMGTPASPKPQPDRYKSANQEDEGIPSPVISETGYQRILNTMQKVSANRGLAEDNLKISEKNILTVENEMKELEVLKREHDTDLTRYERYLNNANSEVARNERELQDLTSWERVAKSAKTDVGGPLRAKLMAVEQEKLDRERWRSDASWKIDRVKKLIKGIDQNKKEMNGRLPYLNEQLSYWHQKKDDYEKAIKDLELKKTELENLAKIHRPIEVEKK